MSEILLKIHDEACFLNFQTYAVVMHTPDLCNKIVKVTADDREIEVVEKGAILSYSY